MRFLLSLIPVLLASLSAQTPPWTKLSPSTSPPPRNTAAGAWDGSQIIVFGGYDPTTKKQLSDTWAWNGTDWKVVSGSTDPGIRETHGMAFDGSGSAVLFGGMSFANGLMGDTWVFRGGKWAKHNPSKSPSPRRAHKLVQFGKQVMLFGGGSGSTYYNDTWTWDGTTWIEQSPPTRPSQRWSYGVAYDENRNRVVLFGGSMGSTYYGDTWEWDGKTWTELKPKTAPSGRWSFNMAYDAVAKRVILFGGRDSSAKLSDTWAWDGSDWSKVASLAPMTRSGHVLVYDAIRRGIVLFSGIDPRFAPLSDTWVLDIAATTETFGKGCASTATIPSLSGTLPRLGQNFSLRISGFLPKPQFGQVIFGASNTRWGIIPLPFSLAVLGMSNCNLLVSHDSSVLFATDAQGGFKTTWLVPSSPALFGAVVFGQAWAPDPKSNYTGVAMTNGIKVVVGY